MQPEPRARLHRALKALADGERAAFDEVFDLAWPVLRSVAARMLDDATEAEDAAQRALLKLFSCASRFDPSRDALPWVLTFGINEIRTVRARRRRRPLAPLEAAREPITGGPDECLERSDLLAALLHVAGTLSAADRAALGIDPDPGSELAAATRRKRKQRAMSRLRTAWRRIHGIA